MVFEKFRGPYAGHDTVKSEWEGKFGRDIQAEGGNGTAAGRRYKKPVVQVSGAAAEVAADEFILVEDFPNQAEILPEIAFYIFSSTIWPADLDVIGAAVKDDPAYKKGLDLFIIRDFVFGSLKSMVGDGLLELVERLLAELLVALNCSWCGTE